MKKVRSFIKKAFKILAPYALIAGFMVFVVVISSELLINQSIRLDESQSLWQTSRTVARIFTIVAEDVHVPLYHVMLHLWQSTFGNDISVARLLSLGFFVLTVPSVYFLAKRAYKNELVSIFASFLVAISPFLNWYANEVRMYTLLTLLVVLNQYFFLRIFRKKDFLSFQFFTITALLGIYTHYFFLAYILTQIIFFLIYRKDFGKEAFKRFVVSGMIVGAAFLPWIIFVIQQGSASNTKPLLFKPTSIDFFNTFNQFLIGFQEDRINALVMSLWPFAIILAFFLLRRRFQERKPETFYFLLNAFLPIIIAFLFSLLIRPFYLSRYLVFTIPSLYILLSYLLTLYPPKIAHLLRVILIFAMMLGFLVQSMTFESPVRENYKEAVKYLNERVNFRDAVVVSAPFTVYPVEYYYTGPTPIRTLPLWDRTESGQIPPFIEEELPEHVEDLAEGHKILWLLLSYDQGYEETIRLYFDSHYERIDHKQFSQGITLYAYQLNYD